MWKECKGNCTMSLLKASYFKDNPYTEWIEVLSSQGDVVNWSTKHDISSDRVNQEICGGSGSRIQVVPHHIMRRLVGKEIHVYRLSRCQIELITITLWNNSLTVVSASNAVTLTRGTPTASVSRIVREYWVGANDGANKLRFTYTVTVVTSDSLGFPPSWTNTRIYQNININHNHRFYPRWI